MRPGLPHRTPPHVRHLQTLPVGKGHRVVAKTDHAPGEHAEALRGPLLARFEQHLQTETDAEERARRRGLDDDLGQPAFAKSLDAIGHRALTRQHDPAGFPYRIRIRGHDDRPRGRDVDERFRHRSQVAHSVIDDRDALSHGPRDDGG